jgi:uncharacterized protein (DUF2062 family)
MQRLRRWIPSKEEILAYSWLQPFRHWLDHDELWEFQRDSVARAVLTGIFIGFTMPLAQMFMGALAAVLLRANVAVSVACTLITNPLTVVPLYFLNYLLGAWLLNLPALSWHMFRNALLESDSIWDGLQSMWVLVGQPLVIGTLVAAVVLSITGYALVKILWRSNPNPTS